MDITDRARDILQDILQQQNAEGIRLYFAGFG